MDELDLLELESHDYNNIDIRRFCRGLEEAWQLDPEVTFSTLLTEIFNGYDLSELSSEELEEMLNDFLLQNQ